MTNRLFRSFPALILALLIAAPASARDKEHQQLMADLRMLQEQAQLLQNMLGIPVWSGAMPREIKAADILQPGPAALTDGVRRMHSILRDFLSGAGRTRRSPCRSLISRPRRVSR